MPLLPSEPSGCSVPVVASMDGIDSACHGIAEPVPQGIGLESHKNIPFKATGCRAVGSLRPSNLEVSAFHSETRPHFRALRLTLADVSKSLSHPVGVRQGTIEGRLSKTAYCGFPSQVEEQSPAQSLASALAGHADI